MPNTFDRLAEFYNQCNSAEDGRFCEGKDGPGRKRDPGAEDLGEKGLVTETKANEEKLEEAKPTPRSFKVTSNANSSGRKAQLKEKGLEEGTEEYAKALAAPKGTRISTKKKAEKAEPKAETESQDDKPEAKPEVKKAPSPAPAPAPAPTRVAVPEDANFDPNTGERIVRDKPSPPPPPIESERKSLKERLAERVKSVVREKVSEVAESVGVGSEAFKPPANTDDVVAERAAQIMKNNPLMTRGRAMKAAEEQIEAETAPTTSKAASPASAPAAPRGRGPQEAIDEVGSSVTGERVIRTAEGAERYGGPIGQEIEAAPAEPEKRGFLKRLVSKDTYEEQRAQDEKNLAQAERRGDLRTAENIRQLMRTREIQKGLKEAKEQGRAGEYLTERAATAKQEIAEIKAPRRIQEAAEEAQEAAEKAAKAQRKAAEKAAKAQREAEQDRKRKEREKTAAAATAGYIAGRVSSKSRSKFWRGLETEKAKAERLGRVGYSVEGIETFMIKTKEDARRYGYPLGTVIEIEHEGE